MLALESRTGLVGKFQRVIGVLIGFIRGEKMIIFLDAETKAVSSFCEALGKEGLASSGFNFGDFSEWFASLSAHEQAAIETIVIGNYPNKYKLINLVKSKSTIPVIALNSTNDLDPLLNLFLAGADDVVGVSASIREISARIGAIRRRRSTTLSCVSVGPLNIYFDGRDPDIDGVSLMLPRRERRILEYLASNRTRRVNRSMIFNSVYGLFEDEVEESVVESHMSKLRKKLKSYLKFDPIDNQRYLGYQLLYPIASTKQFEKSDFPELRHVELDYLAATALAA
jgi:two-component system, OmpR family, flagellar system response regulator FtcR